MTAQRRRAAETAATQLRRLLHLIPQLADGNEHPIGDVARLAGTTPRALLADLNALVDRYDLPGWVDAVSIVMDDENVSVRSDHFLRPMRLSMPELCALELGLMLVRQERPAGEHPAIDSALGRLRRAITLLPANERHEGVRAAVATEAPSLAVLASVRVALRDSRKVRIAYRAGGATEASERVVCPYGLTFASGAWYLVAYCEQSEGLRFFRVDRMESAAGLAQGFERPESFSMEEVLAGGRAFRTSTSTSMTVRYSPRIARWIAEREGLRGGDEESLTLEHPVADIEWAIRHVLQYGPDAEVLAPEDIRMAICDRLRAIGRGWPTTRPR